MQPAEQTTVSPYRWVIGALLLPLNAAIGLNFVAPTPLYPLVMEDYGLNRGTVSLLVVAVAVVFTIFLIPGGLIVAKLGPRKAIAIGGFLVGVGVLAPLASSFWVLVALRLAFGVGGSIAFPGFSGVAVQWFPRKELPVVNGLNLAAQTAGVAAALFLSVPLADALGWRSALGAYGAVALLGTGAWLLLGRSSPAQSRLSGTTPSLGEVVRSLKEKTPLLLAFATVGPNALFLGFSWLPTYYHEAKGMPLDQAGSLVALTSSIGIVMNPLSGVLHAKVGLRRPFLALAGVLMPLAALGAILLDGFVLLAASGLVLGAASCLFLTALLTIPMELPGVTLEKVAVVTAGILTLGNGTAIVAPLFVGMMTDALGSYLPSLLILAFMPVTLLIAVAFLPETGPRAARSAVAPVPGNPR